jgi:molecular chaperone GrpE (heat shock protein)
MSSAAEFLATGAAEGEEGTQTPAATPYEEQPAVEADGPDDTPDRPEGAGGDEPLSALRLELAGLSAEISRFHDVVDRLHAENQDLRSGQLDRIVDPILRDLVKLAGDFRRRGQTWETGRAEAGPADVAKVCRDVAEDADMILERHGVEALVPEPGTHFDRRDHRAAGVEPTADPALDGTIAETRRPGYRFGARVIQFPEVAVHRFAAEPSVDP